MKLVLTLLLLSMAVWMDIRTCRISNRLIASGLTIGLLIQILEYGLKGIGIFAVNISIPVVLLYLLFLMRALGAGDIKLFSVIGSIWDLKVLVITVCGAFLAGALMSLWQLLYQRNLCNRFCVFRDYVFRCLLTGKLEKYPRESDGKQNFIHFSAAILIGFIAAMGVVGWTDCPW